MAWVQAIKKHQRCGTLFYGTAFCFATKNVCVCVCRSCTVIQNESGLQVIHVSEIFDWDQTSAWLPASSMSSSGTCVLLDLTLVKVQVGSLDAGSLPSPVTLPCHPQEQRAYSRRLMEVGCGSYLPLNSSPANDFYLTSTFFKAPWGHALLKVAAEAPHHHDARSACAALSNSEPMFLFSLRLKIVRKRY